MVAPAPLILTLRLDKRSFTRLESERQAFFPPERNFIPAHISIFHALPGEAGDEVDSVLSEVASETPLLNLQIASLRSLGHGVAYKVRCPELLNLQKRLAARFDTYLTRQDRQRYDPHITIQNKVESDVARTTLAQLQIGFSPFGAVGVGLCLWEYLNGPWKFRRSYSFLSPASLQVK